MSPVKRQKMESVLDQLKHHTTVVADTGDFNGERQGGRPVTAHFSPAAQSGRARPERRVPAGERTTLAAVGVRRAPGGRQGRGRSVPALCARAALGKTPLPNAGRGGGRSRVPVKGSPELRAGKGAGTDGFPGIPVPAGAVEPPGILRAGVREIRALPAAAPLRFIFPPLRPDRPRSAGSPVGPTPRHLRTGTARYRRSGGTPALAAGNGEVRSSPGRILARPSLLLLISPVRTSLYNSSIQLDKLSSAVLTKLLVHFFQ